MADEQNTHLEEAATDGERPFADDAVSNRSDDTLLDEGDAAATRSQDWLRAESAGDEAGEENQDRIDQAAQEIASDLGESPIGHASAEDEVAEQEQAEEAEAIEEQRPAARKPVKPIEETPEPEEEIRMDWYILKVQSNRERSIAEALERKMRIEGLDRFFDQVIVPTEKVTEFKGGKKKVVERKLYPGYIVVHMHINDDTWFAVRETSGVGDFTGAGGKPTPMLAHEVSRIVQTEEEEAAEAPKLDIRFASGDKVKVKEGNFESFEGEVNTIDEASGRVTVMINIFGRSTPVELEYWQVENV
jgi:transcription termination/antitermination protein NusG